MCGVVGIFSNSNPINNSEIINAINMLDHRGPDNKQIWLSESKRVGLGHSRLSVIDLEGGTQPLYDQENEIYIVVNGEFYEYDKIYDFLLEKGHKFFTHSDSEILIHLYKRYGINCLKYLNGEFSFILWDKRKQIFFAARDRFGIKPLFYTFFKGDLYIASEMKAFKAFSIPFEWDQENLNFSLIAQSFRTPFKNILPILPAHYILFNGHNFKQEQYWNIDFNNQDYNVDEIEYATELKDKLQHAVNIRLKADVPVALSLSGGIDSTTILSLMAKKQKNIDVFSVIFPDDKASDESMYMKEAVKYYNDKGGNINLHTVEVNDDLIINNFEKGVWHCEYPIVDFPVCGQIQLSKLVRDNNYKVILSGQGSDEILGGYPWHMQDVIELPPDINNFQDNMRSFLKEEDHTSNLSDQTLTSIRSMLGLGTKIFLAKGMCNESISTVDFNKIVNTYISKFNYKNLSEMDTLSKSLYQDIIEFLPGIPLNFRSDRVEMAYSIEGRLPFLDVNVVDFISKIPSKYKINGKREKYILYETFKDEVPHKIYERKKKAFLASPRVSKKWFNYINELISDSIFKEIPFFKKEKINSLINTYKENDRDKLYVPFIVIANAYFLHKNFVRVHSSFC